MSDPVSWTIEQRDAVAEFRYCARRLLEARGKTEVIGCRYALGMAAAEVRLLGLDPSAIGPDGYEVKHERSDSQTS